MNVTFKSSSGEDITVSIEAITCLFNHHVEIKSFDGQSFTTIKLRKSDAIKLHKELKKQISILND